MPIQTNTVDLSGRRLMRGSRDGSAVAIGPAAFYIPVFVFDRDGKQIGKFKSTKKFNRAVISGAIVLVDGDRIVVGRDGDQ